MIPPRSLWSISFRHYNINIIVTGKLTLPVGTSLVIPIHDLHRDPQYWDDPGKVKPERFLPENVMKRDPNAFVPFSLGAMDCLGLYRVVGKTFRNAT